MAPLHGTLVSQIEIINKPVYNNRSISRFATSLPYENIKNEKNNNYKSGMVIVWTNVIFFAILHSIFFYAIHLIVFKNKWHIFITAYIIGFLVGQGITAGSHRLWAHRSYKVKLPLKLLLVVLQTTAFQNSVYEWVRDHRAHHKFTDTDADPHNAKRGFFFSHMGWLMVKKHKDVIEKGKSIDMSDITSDPLLMWQHRYYFPLMMLCCFILPPLLPMFIFGETYLTSFIITGVFRYVLSLHSTWLVNSAAHLYGMKPYDKSIGPSENKLVAYIASGEGFHNYHHVFPWDYKTSELGTYSLNITLAFINFFAMIGQAYDMKTVSAEMIEKRATRTGDGSWYNSKLNIVNEAENSIESEIWGWGDNDMNPDDIACATVLYKSD